MNGFMVFTRKEAREILRMWRVWVLPGILLLFALTGPVRARFTPEIVGAVAGNQLGGLTLPTPTYLDAYTQWIKNLPQVAQSALIIIYGGIVSAETKSGTAVLVLTKPVSRTAWCRSRRSGNPSARTHLRLSPRSPPRSQPARTPPCCGRC